MFIRGKTVYIESATEWIRMMIKFAVCHKELGVRFSSHMQHIDIDSCHFVTIDELGVGCAAINIHSGMAKLDLHGDWEEYIGYFGVFNDDQLAQTFSEDVSHISFLFDCSRPFDSSTEEFSLVRDFIKAVSL